ncbi:MAG: hypothetical protein HGA38_00790 [Candidatus Moranbacteria bacterium]|nr:hypothetical protein [Candidatus Moranbacteria bacterium]NTW45549.1 hypothetical protein [Candidatus Moranbacteria bacterium]
MTAEGHEAEKIPHIPEPYRENIRSIMESQYPEDCRQFIEADLAALDRYAMESGHTFPDQPAEKDVADFMYFAFVDDTQAPLPDGTCDRIESAFATYLRRDVSDEEPTDIE